MKIPVLIIFLSFVFSAFSRDVVIVCRPPGNVVNTGKCILYDEKNDSIGLVILSDNGVAKLPDTGFKTVEVSAEGCLPKLISIDKLECDTIYVKPQITLDEVVVTPDDVEDLGNRVSYRIPQADMDRYTNLYQALNEIPQLTILPAGGAFFEGESNIAFLLNGVKSSATELKAVSKEDILKVDVYSNPPTRFASQGFDAVIDVRTKSGLTGGNIGLNVDQAFYPLKGDNALAFIYNYRRSKFSVLYSGSNAHYNKYRQNEYLEYQYDGVTYKKTKEGKDSELDNDLNNVTLSFQNNKTNNYLYNLQVGLGWQHSKKNLDQSVFSNSEEYNAINFLETNYNKYNIANYFEKQLGKDAKYGTILANVNYQHFNTRYESSYQEFANDDNINTVNNHSAYKTRLDGIFSEIQYEFPRTRLGYFSISAYDTYKHSRYVDSVTPFSQTTNTAGASATWFGRWRSIQWFAMIGIKANHISTTLPEDDYNIVEPNPHIELTWRPHKSFNLSAEYSYMLMSPSIAQLSETDQWLDTRLVYHGNSSLVTSKYHMLSLKGVFSNCYLDASVHLDYKNSPDNICSQYVITDKYMLETIVNLDKYEEILGRLDFTVMPLGNRKLTFWSRLIFARVRGENSQYSWDGNRFQWMSMLSLNLKKWTVSAFYQYPGQVADGQLIRPRAECWYLMAYYRPIKDLSLGLTLFMPFGKGLKDSEHTVYDAPVYSETVSDIRDGANYVSLLLSWNISFGKNKNKATPKLRNKDDDSGLLSK